MKPQKTSIWAIIFVSLFLFSCGEKDALQAEVDYLKANTPKKETTAQKPQEPIYKLGEHYELLEKPYATDNPNQVVVYEFFGYTCPHCFHFEPYINKWLESTTDKLKFVRVPLNFQPSWEIFQKAYLTAEVMGIAEQTHLKLFKALHEEHKRFHTIDELATWFADETDINKEEFLSTADSFILDSKMTKADSMGFQMQITGTPTLIVNGKYRPSKSIRDHDKVMKILRFLINKEAKEMGLFK